MEASIPNESYQQEPVRKQSVILNEQDESVMEVLGFGPRSELPPGPRNNSFQDTNWANDTRDVDTASADASAADTALSASSPAPKALSSPKIRKGADLVIQAHLFGASPTKPKESRKPISKEGLERMAKPRKAPEEPALDKDCTFKPSIDDNSRKILEASATGESTEPRFQILAKSQTPEAKQRLESAKQMKDEAEMAPCTFQPATNWADPKSKSGEWGKSKSRYAEHVPERYVKAKDDLVKKKAAAEAEALKPKEPAPKKAAKQSPRSQGTPTSPGRSLRTPTSPGRSPGFESPRSPLNAYRNIPDAPGQHRGMATHVARLAAGRELQETKQTMLLRPVNEANWIEKRPTTTPVPFRSHTGVRRVARDTGECEPDPDLDDPVFQDLHRLLQSLQLSGERSSTT